ncbi:hypothetical protein [Bacillus songklensis]
MEMQMVFEINKRRKAKEVIHPSMKKSRTMVIVPILKIPFLL